MYNIRNSYKRDPLIYFGGRLMIPVCYALATIFQLHNRPAHIPISFQFLKMVSISALLSA